jgi:LacI family transcriptional regulator
METERGIAFNVRDVASSAGVSTATVSRVLNDVGNVSPDTKERVLVAIAQLHYSPNIHASELGRASAGVPRRRDIRSECDR